MLRSICAMSTMQIHAVLKASGPEAAAKLQKECGAKSVLPKIIKAGYSALNVSAVLHGQ